MDFADSVVWEPSRNELLISLKFPNAEDVKNTVEEGRKITGHHFLEGLKSLQDIKVMTPKKVVFKLKKYDRAFIHFLSVLPIIPNTGNSNFGAFRILDNKEDLVVLKRISPEKDKIEKIKILTVPSPRKAIRQLVAGKVDMVLLANPGDLAILRDFKEISMTEVGGQFIYLVLENQKEKALKNEIEWSLINAKILEKINHDKKFNKFKNPTENPNSPLWSQIEGRLKPLSGDQKKISSSSISRRQLSFLGFHYGDRWLARMVKRHLEEWGIQIDLEPLTPKEFENKIFSSGRFDLVLIPVHIKDPILDLFFLLHTPEGTQSLNFGGYSNREFDRAIEAARYENDPQNAKKFFEKALDELIKKPPGLFLWGSNPPLVYRSDCHGFSSDPSQFFRSLQDVQCVASDSN